jgi:hypothetical protein
VEAMTRVMSEDMLLGWVDNREPGNFVSNDDAGHASGRGQRL